MSKNPKTVALRPGNRVRSAGVCAVALILMLLLWGKAPAQKPDPSTSGTATRIDSRESSKHQPRSTKGDCEPDCTYYHVSGAVYQPEGEDGGVASPGGTTFSVHHRLGSVPTDAGPEQTTCFLIFNPTLPGEPNDVVNYDRIPEDLKTDLFGTVPAVREFVSVTPSGSFFLAIDTFSPSGTDLFPDGLVDVQNRPLTHACFTIGIDDLLDWPGMDDVLGATLVFYTDDVLQIGPLDVFSSFASPWNGFLNVVVPDAAGLGINKVRLEILVEKTGTAPNDDCVNAVSINDGNTEFSNVGATTDGLEEPQVCNFEDDSQIGSDIWYEYVASCTGDLTVSLCDSFYDTKMAVYKGCGPCPPGAPPLACNDDVAFCGVLGEQSEIVVPVVEDNCYTLRVGGFLGDQGRGNLRIDCSFGACCRKGLCGDGVLESDCLALQGQWFRGQECNSFVCPPAPPSNDLCDDHIAIQTDVPFQGTSEGATGTDFSSCVGPGEGEDNADVWHSWTADCTGWATFSLCGSLFDTTLAVYDACDGHELICDDRGCPIPNPWDTSELSLIVQKDQTYYIRIAGFGGSTGDYTLNVSPCQRACCFPDDSCGYRDEQTCLDLDGILLDPKSQCRGRDLNRNGIDDACEPCPEATITSAAPADGTVDARQPHVPDLRARTLGIGSPGALNTQREPIQITLDPPAEGAEHCFLLCETRVEPGRIHNDIGTVEYLGEGQYEIVLQRPITVGAVTTLRYRGDDSFVQYTSHAGNVDANGRADAADIAALIDCCLSNLCKPAWGLYSCDLDRSGRVTTAELLTLVDMFLGLEAYDVWKNTPRPENAICP